MLHQGTVLQQTGHLFTEEDVLQLERASQAQRFGNWLIDNLLMRFGLSWLSGYVVGYTLAKFFPGFYIEMITTKGFEWFFTLYLIAFLNYFVYYSFCEKVFRGYTLGKLITRTRAVLENGEELTWKNAILRSLSRLVPFEVFSGFSDTPWHDSWTKTMVIRVK